MRPMRLTNWDPERLQPPANSLLGGKNNGRNLGDGEPFDHVLLVEETLVLVGGNMVKLNDIAGVRRGGKTVG